MSGFDKFCAVFAFALGAVLLVLGLIGTFIGCSAHFTLPPVLGVLPAFVGWGIVRAIYVGWNVPRYPRMAEPSDEYIDREDGDRPETPSTST